MPTCRSQLSVPRPPPSTMSAGAFDDLSEGAHSDGALGDLSDAEGTAANVPSAPGTPSGVLPRAGEAARAGSRMPTSPTPSSFLPEAAEGRPAGSNAPSRVLPWARVHASGSTADVQKYSTAGGVEDVLLALSEDDDLACFFVAWRWRSPTRRKSGCCPERPRGRERQSGFCPGHDRDTQRG